MNGTFEQILKAGKEACIEHGFTSIGVYQTQNEANVQDGWDRFIISPVHVSESEYKYLGFVRANGEFVGRHLTQRVPDACPYCAGKGEFVNVIGKALRCNHCAGTGQRR